MMGKINCFIGWLLYHLGEKPKISTSIGGGTTAGYGELNEYGFWKYPAPDAYWDRVLGGTQ